MCPEKRKRGRKEGEKEEEERQESQEDPDICLLSRHADKRGGDDEEQKKTIFYTDVQREGRVFLVAARHSLVPVVGALAHARARTGVRD